MPSPSVQHRQLQDEINQVMSGELDHSLERIARELEQERIRCVHLLIRFTSNGALWCNCRDPMHRTGRPLPSDAVQTTVLAAQDISMPNFSAV
jgi:hypothetical protein